MAEILTMPQTAADMQPDSLGALYAEALAKGSFHDPTTGTPMFARMAEVKSILGNPDLFGNELPGHPEVPGTLAPRFPLGPDAMQRAIPLFTEIPRNTAGGDGRDHEENRRVMEDLMPTGHKEAAAELGTDIGRRVDGLM